MDVPWVIGISINVLLRIFKFGPKSSRSRGDMDGLLIWLGGLDYYHTLVLMTGHFISIGIDFIQARLFLVFMTVTWFYVSHAIMTVHFHLDPNWP